VIASHWCRSSSQLPNSSSTSSPISVKPTQAYAASVGNRMNQVMKTLTILTSIFAPLTFIGGIYGMNFEVMPELKWRLGYAYALTLMALIAAIQAWWLWRRGWFEDWTTPR
ncbi:MAG: CorA family divalent cation transporter, partial [Cyanobium sp.]